MNLYWSSDASYLSAEKARSWVGGHAFLGDNLNDNSALPTTPIEHNGAIHADSSILKHVMTSAAEEIAALFKNGKPATIIRNTLEDMGYPQPLTPIDSDNSTAVGILNETIRQKRLQTMDMRF